MGGRLIGDDLRAAVKTICISDIRSVVDFPTVYCEKHFLGTSLRTPLRPNAGYFPFALWKKKKKKTRPLYRQHETEMGLTIRRL